MKVVDLVVDIDGLLIGGGDSVDEVIRRIESVIGSSYNVTYQILYEEEVE